MCTFDDERQAELVALHPLAGPHGEAGLVGPVKRHLPLPPAQVGQPLPLPAVLLQVELLLLLDRALLLLQFPLLLIVTSPLHHLPRSLLQEPKEESFYCGRE